MIFTLKQLRYAEAAGRCGSITEAAELLSISQSSITAAIDALEQALGFDLFIRTPAKGIQPTPSGMDALVHIRNYLEQTNHLDSDLRSLGGQSVGALRVACYVTAAPHVLPLMLKGFARDNPGVRIELTEGDMISVVDQLLDGGVDLACTYNNGLPEQVSFTPLFSAPAYAIISAEDNLAKKSSVTLAELAERPMIVLDLPYSRDYYENLFSARGLRPTKAHSTRSSETVRALAASGFGFSVLNIRAREASRPEYVCLPIKDPIPAIDFGIISIAEVRHPRIVQAFLDHCAKLSREGIFDELMVKRPASSRK
jgi:DNA-binding transcriptional LysR family regulator